MRVFVLSKLSVGGTSCHEASRLSSKHRNDSTGKDSVALEDGSTGETFHSFRRIAVKMSCNGSLIRIWQENVP